MDAVLEDYETAPIDDRLRETLRFLETVTLRPDEADAGQARAAGVSTDALRDAVYVAASFNLITRFADAIGASPPELTREQSLAYGGRFFERGYA